MCSTEAAWPCSAGTNPVVATTSLVNFLVRVQEAALKTLGETGFDPKLYVDLSLKTPLAAAEEAFDNLPRSANGTVSVADLEGFIREYLGAAGDDLVYVEPVDFVAEPPGFLPGVKNREVRKWALEVDSLWKNLSRRVSDDVLTRPELHTLLPLPEPGMIPGSRFREVYYWDSYWVVRGLLASKLYQTAKSIVTNLIFLVEEYGFVLNGARAYYTNRSQPPVLSAMVRELYNKTEDIHLVNRALPALLKEHNFWNSRNHKVTVQDAHGCTHNLSRYYAMWNKPRPESSTIDKEFASKLTNLSGEHLFFLELASAAESGWDFSTRWMRNSSDFLSLATTSIIPVDLNAFVLGMELDIAFLATVTGECCIAENFREAAQERKKAIDSILWKPKMGQWLDYWLCEEGGTRGGQNQDENIFASNFLPLWIESFYKDTSLVEKVMKSFRSSGLLREAGIATSLTDSGQQWDFPNGWAPLQHMIVEGLARSGSQQARVLAEDIAVRWIRTNYAAYKKTGTMHEKYNVERCGEVGGGGEYAPQTGFGWSNGVVLAFLEEFGWPEDLKIDC